MAHRLEAVEVLHSLIPGPGDATAVKISGRIMWSTPCPHRIRRARSTRVSGFQSEKYICLSALRIDLIRDYLTFVANPCMQSAIICAFEQQLVVNCDSGGCAGTQERRSSWIDEGLDRSRPDSSVAL